MVIYGDMTLDEHIKRTGVKNAEFARLIGVSGEAVRRYREGARIPSAEVMRRIVRVTGGAVQPNDFYELDGEAAE